MAPDRTPAVSVVVATRDRADRLDALLASLCTQTVERARFEVIVVDDGSRDDTPARLDRAAARGELDLRVVRREVSGGPAAARDDGWRLARAPFVAFTDDDCAAAPRWLEAGLGAHAEDPGAVVQGRTDPAPDELDRWGPFARSLTVHELSPAFPTCNVFFPRAALQRVGGFDADTFHVPGGEDADLAWRVLATGARAVFAPDAQIFHAVSDLGPVGKLRVAWRWTATMRIFARHPQLRRTHLYRRVFWKGSHYLLLRALLALVLPRRLWWARFWLGRAYVLHLGRRREVEGGAWWIAPYFVVHDLVELAAVLRGALRYRTFVL